MPQIVTAMDQKNPTNKFGVQSFSDDEVEELFFPPKTADRIAATEGFQMNGVPDTIFFAPQTDQDMEKILMSDQRRGKRKAAPIPDFEGRLKSAAPKVSPFKPKQSCLTEKWKDGDFVSTKNSALAEKMREVHAFLLREEAWIRKDFPSLRHKNDKFVRHYFPHLISAIETFPEVLENYSAESISEYLPHVSMKMAVFIHNLATHKGNDPPKIVPEVNLKDRIYRFTVKKEEDSDD